MSTYMSRASSIGNAVVDVLLHKTVTHEHPRRLIRHMMRRSMCGPTTSRRWDPYR